MTQQIKHRNLCIISNKSPVYSETFIRAHLERLPARITFLHGRNFFPIYQENNLPLARNTFFQLTQKIYQKLFRTPANLQEIRAFKSFLKQQKIDAVLAEYGQTGVAVKEICSEMQIPLIVHFHGYDAYNRTVVETAGKEYPQLFQTAAAAIAVSKDMQQQLLNLGAVKEKLYYNPYGVDTTLFAQTNPALNSPLFVAVGRLVDKKAPCLTILAFKSVLESFPEARLVLIGDGPLRETCHQLIQSLNLSEKIELLGARSHAEVAASMQKARAFVQHSLRTSYGDSEGTPVAVLEASATGIPVVATRHAGIKDVVVENETGLLVDEGDITAMAQQMLKLAQDPNLAAQLGQAARERICQEYSIEKSINSLWRIIEEAIASHH